MSDTPREAVPADGEERHIVHVTDDDIELDRGSPGMRRWLAHQDRKDTPADGARDAGRLSEEFDKHEATADGCSCGQWDTTDLPHYWTHDHIVSHRRHLASVAESILRDRLAKAEAERETATLTAKSWRHNYDSAMERCERAQAEVESLRERASGA